MGRVSPACTVGAADGTGTGGCCDCCPSTALGAALSTSKGCCAATPALTPAASTTAQIVRTIILAPSCSLPTAAATAAGCLQFLIGPWLCAALREASHFHDVERIDSRACVTPRAADVGNRGSNLFIAQRRSKRRHE